MIIKQYKGVIEMSLKQRWLEVAFIKREKKEDELFWEKYLSQEQKIYEDILGNKITKIEGKLSQLAKKYNMSNEFFFGFLDGIRGAVEEVIDIDTIEEDSDITLTINYEKLYKEMVEYKAEHLYTLPAWNDIFDEAKRKELYLIQKKSKTIISQNKVGRNDPCPCGSGKKYKKCCGVNV
jgi:uncharacterized protein YecA (UPF0149 family)